MLLSRPSVYRQTLQHHLWSIPVNTNSHWRPRPRYRASPRWISSWRRLIGGLIGEYSEDVVFPLLFCWPNISPDSFPNCFEGGNCCSSPTCETTMLGPVLEVLGYLIIFVIVLYLCEWAYDGARISRVPFHRSRCRRIDCADTQRLRQPLSGVCSAPFYKKIFTREYPLFACTPSGWTYVRRLIIPSKARAL